ncbi:IucA/IucC family protein [Pseudonocardia hispaniensis]|uniref:IucA/IucC family protein n=1 Tax=Pseudonocardia hispaniensis TaxID=904933 RepID=A0ABW1IZH1_9PSEU
MSAESRLLQRVLDALLREDHLGLSSAGAPVNDPALPALPPDQTWWRARLRDGHTVALPVRPDGFLAEHAVAAPILVLDGPHTPGGPVVVDSLAGALAALAPDGDAETRAGWADFIQECTQTLATVRLHDLAGPRLRARLAGEPPVAGFAGMLRHEALAALRDHPVYPTGRCRWGLSETELRRYAPEFQPSFPLRWVVVPRARLRFSPAFEAAGPPGWWPAPSRLGARPEADRDHLAVPVHPLTADRGVPGLVAATGPTVTPTLSTRTVALDADPGVHLKLPLPTATLGRRNRRTIAPGTLADGDTVHRLLTAVLRREPRLRRRVLLADETRWLDSPDDDRLAVLVRRYPAELAGDTLVPLAALLAPDPHRPGDTVLDGLAARHTGADPIAWFDAYLCALLDWHLALWLRYGIALEAHQQNITVAVREGDPDWLRLVYKDDDGARIDCARLAAALGQDAPLPVTPAAFHDRRIAVSDPAELADVVVTITLHLCVGALVVEHAGADANRRGRLFALARGRVEEAAQRWCDPADPGSVAATDLLRRHVLEADRWPIKAMVTAGTLLPKHRLGCADVNKHYRRSGPNYLRTGRREERSAP